MLLSSSYLTHGRTSKTSNDTRRPRRARRWLHPAWADREEAARGLLQQDVHKAIKQLALDLDRKVEDLMGEAFHDLLVKLNRHRDAELFKD